MFTLFLSGWQRSFEGLGGASSGSADDGFHDGTGLPDGEQGPQISSLRDSPVTPSNGVAPIFIDGNDPDRDWDDCPYVTGSGTYGDPYLIQDLTINCKGYGDGIYIANTRAYFRVENCTVLNSGAFPKAGIRLEWAGNGSLVDNKCFSARAGGIVVSCSANVTLTSNRCTENEGTGIEIYESLNITVEWGNCSFNGDTGILIYHSNETVVSHNIASHNGNRGITSSESNSTVITHNLCSYNKQLGIIIAYANDNIAADNNCTNNLDGGIWATGYCNRNLITRNNCSFNGHWQYSEGGICLSRYCNSNIISDNICNFNEGAAGIRVQEDSYNNTVTRNTCLYNRRGMYLYECFGTILSYNNISHNQNDGIYIMGETQLMANYTIIGNNFTANWKSGITIYHSKNGNITGNLFYLNRYVGVYLIASQYLDVYENQFIKNAYGGTHGGGAGTTFYNNTRIEPTGPIYIDGNNSSRDWDDCPYVTGSGTYLDPYIIQDLVIRLEEHGYCILIANTTAYFRVENCTFSADIFVKYGVIGKWEGGLICLENAHNGTILNNTLGPSGYSGISVFESSSYNNITFNDCSANQNGIAFFSSKHNNVTFNNCTANNRGISLSLNSNTNNITHNHLFDNSRGINIESSESNYISQNNISANDIAIRLVRGSESRIYRNNCTKSNSHGFYMEYTDDCDIAYNNVSLNIGKGILLGAGCDNNDVHLNWFIKNGEECVWGSQGNNVTNNICVRATAKIYIDGNNSSRDWDDCPYVTGSGTYLDPYIIQDLTINVDEPGCGILIANTTDYFRIENCTIFATFGSTPRGGLIKLVNAANGTLYGNRLENSSYSGIAVLDSLNISVDFNAIDNHKRHGVYFRNTNTSLIQHSNMTNCQNGIFLEKSYQNNLTNNLCTYNDAGINLQKSDGLFLEDNNCSLNSEYGIYTENLLNTTLKSNLLMQNGRGLSLQTTHNSSVVGNQFLDNTDVELEIGNSHENNVSGNSFITNLVGISLSLSSKNEISLNNFTGFSDYGVHIKGSSHNNTVSQNIFEGPAHWSGYCIHIEGSTNNTIYGNKFLNHTRGIKLTHASLNRILWNNFTSISDFAIYLFESYNNTVGHNTLTGLVYPESYGIYLTSADYNMFHGNNCSDYEIGFYLQHEDHGNSIIGNDIRGVKIGINSMGANHNITGNTLSVFTDTGMIVSGSTPSVVSDNTLNSSSGNVGIRFYDQGIVSGNNITGGGWGIQVWGNDSTITGNFITAFTIDGIWVVERADNNVSGNVCTGGPYGIRISKGGQTVLGNNCSHNSVGILLEDSDGQNTLSRNNCSYNSFAGIRIMMGSFNHVFRNVLIRNVQWCILDEGSNNNIHDNFCLLPAPTILTSSQSINTASLLVDWTDVNGAWSYNVYVNDILNTTAVTSETTVHFSFDATHSVTVTPVHNVTEGDRSDAIFITVDTTPPSWDETPMNQTVEYGAGFGYDLNASDLHGLDTWWLNDTTHFTIDGAGVITNDTVLSTGVYGLQVWVNDTFNNIQTATFTITVEDTTAPTWDESISDQLVELGTQFSYDVNASDLAGIDHYWLNDTAYFTVDYAGMITNATFLPVGIYHLEVRAYDGSNNYCTATFTVTVEDTVTPTWNEPPTDQNSEFGSSFSYDVNASDLSGIDHYWINDTVHFSIDTNGIISNVTKLAIGTYGLEIRAYDPYGLFTTAMFKVSVEDTTSPTWDETPTHQTVELGDPFSYDVNASDLSGIDHYWINDTANFQIDGNGVIVNATFLPVDTYGLEIRVYDSSDNYRVATLTVRVQDTTPPTWVVYVPTLIILEPGESLDYLMDAWDLSGIDHWTINDSIHFTITNRGRVSTIPDIAAGDYGLTVRAFDPYGNYCEAVFKVRVKTETTTTTETTTETPPPPVIPGFPLTSIILGVVAAVGILFLMRRLGKANRSYASCQRPSRKSGIKEM